jgi:hypothetical protein
VGFSVAVSGLFRIFTTQSAASGNAAYAGEEPGFVGNQSVRGLVPVCGPMNYGRFAGAQRTDGGLPLRAHSLLFLLGLWLDCVLLHLSDGLLNIHAKECDHQCNPG